MKDSNEGFLPVTRDEYITQGIYYLDFILVSADAYVDHPAFPPTLLGRYLQSLGFAAGVIAQPGFRNLEDFQKLGRPRYAFLVCPGNVDAMVALYTVNKRKRSEDAYSPGGKTGLRPERPCTVYTQRLKEAFPNTPVILGGLEASLRRFAHYDYWQDAVRPSILAESGADLLVYGMGELPLREIAARFKSGRNITSMKDIPGTCYMDQQAPASAVILPSFAEVAEDKRVFAACFKTQYLEQDYCSGKQLTQIQEGGAYLVQNPPMRPMTMEELDDLYELPFIREQHPMYAEKVPALEEVKFSLVSSRGCFGGCAFCSIHFHQGRHIQARSKESLLREAEALTHLAGFKGYIHDVGGPTANFTRPPCEKFRKKGACRDKSCLSPEKCPNLKATHTDYLEKLRALRKVPGVKKVFIRSGIRFDYLMYDDNGDFLKELIRYHISGQLKVAPEHISDKVLTLMRKPVSEVYLRFARRFRELNASYGLKQYLVPYFISSHPGSTLADAVALAEYIRDTGVTPEQVQDFYPTPGTLSTCMYYTGLDPLTGQEVYVPRTNEEKRMQRALLQFKKPENHALVKRALLQTGRTDLIGYHPRALIPPRPFADKAKKPERK